MINKVIICPVCGKKTFLRIQDGGYLNEYPIRVNCYHCKALLSGIYFMNSKSGKPYELIMVNAIVEECDAVEKNNSIIVKNADYVAEISGELPCDFVCEYNGEIPLSPYMKIANYFESIEDEIQRLSVFSSDMEDWKRKKHVAFQLLDDGSIEYISKAINNRIGDYFYDCDNYLKSLHCLQEVFLDETKYLFKEDEQNTLVNCVIRCLSVMDNEKLHSFIVESGGVNELLSSYKKVLEVFSGFMSIYPNLLPAETYKRLITRNYPYKCISTCTFSDIKNFYQDSYEALLSLMYIPVCLDNILFRENYNSFSKEYNDVYVKDKKRDFEWYKSLNNGIRYNKLSDSETFQSIIAFSANIFLRNGIGHNNYVYDSVTQKITTYGLKNPQKIEYNGSLMDVALDCIGMVKSAVAFSEIILFFLRFELRREGIRSIIHPRFYKNIQPNDCCPCGSKLKYKKCCQREVEAALKSIREQ